MMGLIVIQNQQSACVHQKNDFENVLQKPIRKTSLQLYQKQLASASFSCEFCGISRAASLPTRLLVFCLISKENVSLENKFLRKK